MLRSRECSHLLAIGDIRLINLEKYQFFMKIQVQFGLVSSVNPIKKYIDRKMNSLLVFSYVDVLPFYHFDITVYVKQSCIYYMHVHCTA